jgi:hypothetical protein
MHKNLLIFIYLSDFEPDMLSIHDKLIIGQVAIHPKNKQNLLILNKMQCISHNTYILTIHKIRIR